MIVSNPRESAFSRGFSQGEATSQWGSPTPMMISPPPFKTGDPILTPTGMEWLFGAGNQGSKSPDPRIHEIPGVLTEVKFDDPVALPGISSIAPSMSNVTRPWAEKSYFKTSLANEVVLNNAYRKVLYTGQNDQIVIMSLRVFEIIDAEIHPETQQTFIINDGEGYFDIRDNRSGQNERFNFMSGDIIVIPPGTLHKLTATTNLKLTTIYSPPEHPDGLVQQNKPIQKSSVPIKF